MKDISRRHLSYGLVVLAAAALAIVLVRNGPGMVPGAVSPTPTPVSGSPAAGQRPAEKVPADYGAAVTQYEGRRIQFGQYCNAIPTSVTYKNGTSIMLDNRSGEARHVKVGPTAYNLAGYGWRVITLTSKSLPSTLLLDCGASRNVGTILLQK